jgi:hypothetical protein
MSDLSLSLVLSTPRASKDAQEQAIVTKSDTSSHLPFTLDDPLVPKPASTVIFPVRDVSAAQYGLNADDLLIVDRRVSPEDNHLVVNSANDGLIISRYRSHQIRLSSKLPDQSENVSNVPIWGVVTYSIS